MLWRPIAAGALTVALAAVPATAVARSHPHNGHRISIHAQPNPDQTGDPVVIFGRLTGPNNGNRVLTLWHRINPRARFTPVQHVLTDGHGFYLIQRADGVVTTNRNWFVRALGAQSRTVHERVQAIVSFQSPATQAQSNQALTFTGTVTPGRRGEAVVLQRQDGAGGGTWRTIAGTRRRTDASGHYSITHRFRIPDTYTLRARFIGDRRNLGAASDSSDVVVQQRQNPKLTLTPSADPITVGDPVTLTGTLAGAGSGQTVTLYAHEHGRRYAAVATMLTDGSGGFSFTQVPLHTTTYQVRANGTRSAQVFEAVRDRITATADNTSPTTGQVVTFSGAVAPDHTGHLVELQRQGIDGAWHDVQYSRVRSGSTYTIRHQVQSPGTKVFRVHIDGGPFNWGASSGPITLQVAPPPPTP